MLINKNNFKDVLKLEETLYGLWVAAGENLSAEICASADFDWLLIDSEHGPNDLRSIFSQLQAVAPYKSHPIVRPPEGNPVLIKQLLETGVQTLLIPMVESADQATHLVEAMRYPPDGIRGVGSALARVSRWGRVEDYLSNANDEMCLLVQVETVKGFEALDEILEIEGVDGVFFGSADLAASYGSLGQSYHPSIVNKILDGLQRVKAKGKAGGVLCTDKELNEQYISAGAKFVAVGVDTLLLANATSTLCKSYKLKQKEQVTSKGY